MPLAAPPLPERSLTAVLSEIAETASETLELQEVFDRIATSVRRVIPFDHMGVVRILDGAWAVKHATTFQGGCPAGEAAESGSPRPAEDPSCVTPKPLSNWSPRIRPRAAPIPRIDNAERELEPAFHADAELLKAGVRSALWAPFGTGEQFGGGVWLCAFHPYAFNEEHEEFLRPIAALLGSAVEHWRLWDIERRRRDRLDRIESLLGTLAESLDVRQVFQRLSERIQAVLPHDMMVLTELDLRSRSIRVVAHAGESDIRVPGDAVPLTPLELERRVDFEVIHDIPAEIEADTERQRIIVSSGLRSWLRVPVWQSGEVKGGLSFFHRDPSRYIWEDTEVAIRLADRIALMLSYQQLAEEARIAAEARERAERLEATVETLARELAAQGRSPVVGESRSFKEVLLQVGRVASSETTVLITGESGTGKEVVSSLVHQGSPRAGKPFVAINCAALPEQLLESELFGHERGAFTGAVATKIGRIEQAEGGTLFLDEIAEMSPLVQAKLLRVLEAREFQRVGGSRTLKADVRIIAATNRDLATAIERQAFREDLYYRLNVFHIPIPPLRERREDILPLAEAYLHDLGRKMGRPAAGISRDAREWLLEYSWPGNVRELRNAIERAILLCDGGLITHDHFPSPMVRPGRASSPVPNGSQDPARPPSPGGLDLGAMERSLLEKALTETRGNKSRAARLLGLTRAQLYSRIEKHGVQ